MQRQSEQFFRKLIETPSPSGFEAGAQALVRRQMAAFCAEVIADAHGNVIGAVNPGKSLRVMLAGHCDEVGFIVMHIDKQGFLFFAGVGGVDTQVAVAQRVRVHGRKGPVLGVIGRKPIHLQEKDDAGKAPKMHELWIDIGARDKRDAERAVGIGDYVTVDAGFETMRNDLAAGRGFDDRVGSFIVVETLRRLSARRPAVSVYGVSTVQEELGLRGARTSAYGIDPHVGIAIDVGHATDYPGAEPKLVGECSLGKGPALHRGPNINPRLGRMLEQTAKNKRIPVQITAEPRATGTDANAIQINRSGVATALISIPNRYMHTPVEMISLKDVENAVRLLTEFLAALKPSANFVPGSPGD